MQNNIFVHFQIVALCTNPFLICNSNNLIPVKVFVLKKLLYSKIEVERIVFFVLKFGYVNNEI